MAKYNEILTGRFNRFLQKYFQMKGEAPAPQLSSDISVTHGFFSGVENRFPESWYRWGASAVSIAVGAQTNGVQIRNPVASGAIVVVEKMTVWTATAQEEIDFGLGLVSVDLATGVGSVALDGREVNTASAAASVSMAGNSPTSLPTFGRTRVITNVPYDYITFEDQEIVVAPGFALRIVSTVANQDLAWTLNWRERALEESELK